MGSTGLFSWFYGSAYAIVDHLSECCPSYRPQFWLQWVLMWHKYWYTFPIDEHQVIWAWSIYVVFKGCIHSWYKLHSNLINIFISNGMYAVMWGPHVDFSRSAVGHLCAMWQVYLAQGHMPVMWNAYMPVVMVTFSIALSSCEVDILM